MISVIMSEYGTKAEYLRASIESILNQTFTDFEFIIVDDCGKNNVALLAKKYSDDRIRVIKNDENRGLVYSLNEAVRYAKGEYLVRMDTDDIAHPQRLEKLYTFITKHPEYAVVGSRVVEFSESGDTGILCQAGEKTPQTLVKGDSLVHPSVIMRKNVVEDVGGYPDFRRAEDFALWAELLLVGYRLYVLDDVLLHYRVNRDDFKKRKLRYRAGELKAKLYYYPKLKAQPRDYFYILKSVIAGILPVWLVRKYRNQYRFGTHDNNLQHTQERHMTIKKKVYTLTCTWAASYGAVLQAYALAKKINILGWQAEIINYQPEYYNKTLVKKILAPLYAAKRFLLERLYLDFLHDSGMLTKKAYRNFDDLNNASLPAETFVVGSDQVWNCTKYYNGKDDAMFLDFAKPDQKRIAYAASLAMPEVPSEQVDRYKRLLSKFDTISVREKTGESALSTIGISDVKTVIDPVYLVSAGEWSGLAEKSEKKFDDTQYLLVVCLENRDEVYEYARKKANALGVKLYSLQSGIKGWKKHPLVDKNFWNVSVYDYLNIVKSSKAVVTDSFHAMSFSLIFNNDVDIIPRDDKGNSRMIDLLGDLGIADRVTTSEKLIVNEIDFTLVNKAITKKTNDAVHFLQDSVGDGRREVGIRRS